MSAACQQFVPVVNNAVTSRSRYKFYGFCCRFTTYTGSKVFDYLPILFLVPLGGRSTGFMYFFYYIQCRTWFCWDWNYRRISWDISANGFAQILAVNVPVLFFRILCFCVIFLSFSRKFLYVRWGIFRSFVSVTATLTWSTLMLFAESFRDLSCKRRTSKIDQDMGRSKFSQLAGTNGSCSKDQLTSLLMSAE